MKTFAGIQDRYGRREPAAVVLLPVPYDGTSTWQKGADKGPDAFLKAAENMELYDIETDSEVYKRGIFLAGAITENRSPRKMMEAVKTEVNRYLKEDKLVTLFGGEHSISIGAMSAMKENHPDLNVLQIDAHADLRSSYEGSPYNHACAVYHISRSNPLVQVGIRSMDVAEKEAMEEDHIHTFYAWEMQQQPDWVDRAVERLSGPVYITIDLDAFDSSIMPSTGTPEPGGMDWTQMIALLRKVCREKEVVGFDIVELCPNPHNKAPDFLAAKLYYQLLSYIFKFR